MRHSRHVKHLLGLVLIVACGAPQPPTTRSINFYEQTRSDPAPFFGVPGFRQVIVTSTVSTELYAFKEKTLQLIRGGDMVCEAALDGARSFAHVELRSRDPLRFEVNITTSDGALTGNGYFETCRRYEVPRRGTCRVVVEQTCKPFARCTREIRQRTRPGSGRLVATFTHDGEPFVGNAVEIDEDAATTDEHGRVEKAVEIGSHRVRFYGAFDDVPLSVRLDDPRQDVVLEVAGVGCACCGA